MGQICLLQELQSFEIATFDLGHPVCSPLKRINLSDDAWECPGFLLQFTFSSFVRTSWSGAVTRFNTSPGRDPSDPFP